MRPEVWFAIPSANPENCRKVLPIWREMGYRIAVLQNHERAEIPADRVVWSDTYPGWGASINRLCREVVPASATIVVSGGDDMLPDPDHDAAAIATQFLERFPDTFGVMQPHGDDFLLSRLYCGSPWIGRLYFERMYGGDGPMWKGYGHNWADMELYWTARGVDALWLRPDLTQYHEHFQRQGDEPPDYWQANVAGKARSDTREFILRAWRDFPGHAPLGLDRPFTPGPGFVETIRTAEQWYMDQCLEAGGAAAERAAPVERALARCAEMGHTRVALYGAGAHTQRIGAALCTPPVEIVAIIDDDPARHGQRRWGFSVVGAGAVPGLGVQAVVLSSDAHEGALWDRAAPLREAGIDVVRVYGPSAHEKNERARRALRTLAEVGCRRLALYGAGAHTRDLAPALRQAGDLVDCIADDAPTARGERVHGRLVVGPDDLPGRGVDGVILSSDRHERLLWDRTQWLRDRGVLVVPLYEDSLAPMTGLSA